MSRALINGAHYAAATLGTAASYIWVWMRFCHEAFYEGKDLCFIFSLCGHVLFWALHLVLGWFISSLLGLQNEQPWELKPFIYSVWDTVVQKTVTLPSAHAFIMYHMPHRGPHVLYLWEPFPDLSFSWVGTGDWVMAKHVWPRFDVVSIKLPLWTFTLPLVHC